MLDFTYGDLGDHEIIQSIGKFDAGSSLTQHDDIVTVASHGTDAVVPSEHTPIGGKTGINEMENAAIRQRPMQLIPSGDDHIVLLHLYRRRDCQ